LEQYIDRLTQLRTGLSLASERGDTARLLTLSGELDRLVLDIMAERRASRGTRTAVRQDQAAVPGGDGHRVGSQAERDPTGVADPSRSFD